MFQMSNLLKVISHFEIFNMVELCSANIKLLLASFKCSGYVLIEYFHLLDEHLFISESLFEDDVLLFLTLQLEL